MTRNAAGRRAITCGRRSWHTPLILTLALDAPAFAFFDGLRRAHFPPERNVIPAHLTLFHALPGEHLAEVAAMLAAAAARPAPALRVSGVRLLGGGVAYAVESEALLALRRELAGAFQPWLTPQDRQRFSPHVTVQNKVPPAAARALHAELSLGFRPFEAASTGLVLWHYLGGPWRLAREFPFGGSG